MSVETIGHEQRPTNLPCTIAIVRIGVSSCLISRASSILHNRIFSRIQLFIIIVLCSPPQVRQWLEDYRATAEPNLLYPEHSFCFISKLPLSFSALPPNGSEPWPFSLSPLTRSERVHESPVTVLRPGIYSGSYSAHGIEILAVGIWDNRVRLIHRNQYMIVLHVIVVVRFIVRFE